MHLTVRPRGGVSRLQREHPGQRNGNEDPRPGLPPQVFHLFQVPRGAVLGGQVSAVGGPAPVRQGVSQALQERRQPTPEKGLKDIPGEHHS
ncbi:hypothetical protein CDAR_473511 [Caerostris darwini]|uniref:Uncharacterized protein n=1 Tax=Caerostris darwini TaxID=1538125 RepID=A0AAV4RB95_9ARAC|nr:hypothetical protein CDAR_473511 [Caerostris darwini]